MQCNVKCSAVQRGCNAVQCSAVQCSAGCSVVQCSTSSASPPLRWPYPIQLLQQFAFNTLSHLLILVYSYPYKMREISVFCPLSSVLSRLSSVVCRLSSVVCLLSSVLCPLSFVLCPLSSVLCPLSSVLCAVQCSAARVAV